MTDEPNGRPHLPNLSIKGFRGIGALDIPHLGRVTLLAGRNGVGKTAVTEAIRVYASRGRWPVLSALLRRHEEFASASDEDGDRMSAPDLAALFHGRDVSPNSRIEIGPKGASGLKITVAVPSGRKAELLERLYHDIAQDAPPLIVEVSFAKHRRTMPWLIPRYTNTGGRDIRAYRRRFEDREEAPPEMSCRSLGPGLPNNDEVAELWDKIALTDDEERAVRALNLVLGDRVDRVSMIGDGSPRYRPYGRRVVVKLRDHDRPVSLRSLGDGATRLFGVALNLAGSRGGFLTIDEAENGIHHSVHEAFWRMVLRTAEENDVQVFATTHSFDCVRGFARAAVDFPESEGVLVRLEQEEERTRAVVYSESELETAAEQDIEVR